MSGSKFGWNSERGKQEQSFSWLRGRLKEESVLLLSDPGGFFKKYPPHIAPAVAIMQEMIQKYVDSGDLDGSLERYYVTVATGRKFSTYIATIDKEKIGEYFVRNQETKKELPFFLHYQVPAVELGEHKVRHSLDFFLSKPEEWKVGGPGVIFGGPVVEVTF